MPKELNDLALSTGRKMLSLQTGFLHYFYEYSEEECYQTIPLMENVLFSLALFQSRLVENINEGKILLGKLLAFQSGGNFPIYLHDYPQCKDITKGIHLLAPFYWILKHFGHILGQELRNKLEIACTNILEQSKHLKISYSPSVRLACANIAFSHEGYKILTPFQEENEYWHNTNYLIDLLIGLQMVYPSLKNSPWNKLWTFLEKNWHLPTGTYIGPSTHEEQKKGEPHVTPYDLFLGYFSRSYSSRALTPNPAHLYGALIQPTEDFFDKTHHNFNPFKLVWGSSSYAHTFVCQGNKCKIDSVYHEDEFELFFTLENEPDLNHIERQREINFYFDYHPEVRVLFDGQKANTFELGQAVTIESGDTKISINFQLIEGEGHFFGHLNRGNRPSQIDAKGKNRFQSYDWHLFLRTLRRSRCVIKATIKQTTKK